MDMESEMKHRPQLSFERTATHSSYLEADARVRTLYGNPDDWARTAILNIAASGKFSSDRTIAEYAAEIWRAQSCPVAAN